MEASINRLFSLSCRHTYRGVTAWRSPHFKDFNNSVPLFQCPPLLLCWRVCALFYFEQPPFLYRTDSTAARARRSGIHRAPLHTQTAPKKAACTLRVRGEGDPWATLALETWGSGSAFPPRVSLQDKIRLSVLWVFLQLFLSFSDAALAVNKTNYVVISTSQQKRKNRSSHSQIEIEAFAFKDNSFVSLGNVHLKLLNVKVFSLSWKEKLLSFNPSTQLQSSEYLSRRNIHLNAGLCKVISRIWSQRPALCCYIVKAAS